MVSGGSLQHPVTAMAPFLQAQPSLVSSPTSLPSRNQGGLAMAPQPPPGAALWDAGQRGFAWPDTRGLGERSASSVHTERYCPAGYMRAQDHPVETLQTRGDSVPIPSAPPRRTTERVTSDPAQAWQQPAVFSGAPEAARREVQGAHPPVFTPIMRPETAYLRRSQGLSPLARPLQNATPSAAPGQVEENTTQRFSNLHDPLPANATANATAVCAQRNYSPLCGFTDSL